MTSQPRDRDLEADLSEQLQFLASSGRAFDQGDLPESKRIALVIRVLVHDTAMSHSLLAQLGIKDSLAWADSAPVIDNDPNIVGRSPGLTSMGLGADGIAFSARHMDSIERSNTTRYVSFSDWWERPVILDSNDAEFSRKELVLALVNKDGGAHLDRLNAKTHALVHGNSAGFVRIDKAGGTSEPIPTPIYASVRTVAEELLLTLRRSGRTVPSSPPVNPLLGMIDSFTAADYTGKPLVLDKSRDMSRTSASSSRRCPVSPSRSLESNYPNLNQVSTARFPPDGWTSSASATLRETLFISPEWPDRPTEALLQMPWPPGRYPRLPAHL